MRKKICLLYRKVCPVKQKSFQKNAKSFSWKDMGIKNKAFLQAGVLVVVALLAAVGAFAITFQRSAVKEQAQYIRKRLQNINVHLNTYINEISAIANETNYDYYLQNYLMNVKEGEGSSITMKKGGNIQNYEMGIKIFSYAINNRFDVSSILVFGKKEVLLYKSLYTYRNAAVDYREYTWYQEAVENPRKTIVTGPQTHVFLSGNTEKTLSLSRVISSSEDGSFLGVILIDINLNQISEICTSSYNNDGSAFAILDKEGKLVYDLQETAETLNFQNSEVKEKLKKYINQDIGETMIDLGADRYQLSVENMPETGWNLVSLTPRSTILKAVNNTIRFIIISGAALMIVILMALNSILSKVIKPITLLKSKMDEAEASNLEVRAEVVSGDEVGMLAQSYNKMMDRIENLMDQVVIEQESKRKFELEALQAQINPHFLYNTLDSIIWMAETKDEKVVPMTEALARLFRIALNKGNEFIALENEIEHVRNYLVIQSMRYRNKFDYEIVIDDAVRKCRTIKLIIQPVVENSIYHGIKKKKAKGNIGIHVYKNQGKVWIEVTDNGAGMSPEVCRSILETSVKREDITGSGVGVRNVNARIRLYFGEEYGLQFESSLGEGTKATICIPDLPMEGGRLV